MRNKGRIRNSFGLLLLISGVINIAIVVYGPESNSLVSRIVMYLVCALCGVLLIISGRHARFPRHKAVGW